MKNFTRIFGAVFIVLAFACFAKDDIFFAGGGSQWKIVHRRLAYEGYLNTNSTEAISAMANALALARNADKKSFDYLFAMEGSSLERDQLYNRWQTASRVCTFLIVDEAYPVFFEKGQSNTIAAFSLAPFGFPPSSVKSNDLSVLHADVVFLNRTNGIWKLSLTGDERLKGYLMDQASTFMIQPDPHIITSLPEFNAKRQEANEKAIVQGLQDAGAKPAQLNTAKETFMLQKGGAEIVQTNWEAWKRHFNFHELDETSAYNVQDSWVPDFSNPLAAQRSFRHAIYTGDAKTLYQHADDTGTNELRRFVGDMDVKKKTYEIFPKITRYIPLFTASTKYNGNEYVLVFFRAQEGIDPTVGRVGLLADIFKRTGTGYVFTGDLDTSSTFGNPGRAAHVGFMFLPKYPAFLEIAKHSDFPEKYYKIE